MGFCGMDDEFSEKDPDGGSTYQAPDGYSQQQTLLIFGLGFDFFSVQILLVAFL